MATTARERGLQALAELYPDPTIRQARQEELGDAGLETLGKAALRQDDYSRSMNATAEEKRKAEELYQQNVAWFEEKKKQLAELEELRAKVAAGGTGTPTPDPAAKPNPKYLTREDLDVTERGAVAFMTDLNALTLKHYRDFNEVLDTASLLTDPRVQKIGLIGVYEDRFKDQIAAKAKAVEDAKVEAIRKDEREKLQKELASQSHQYPVRGNEPSTLDALEARAKDQSPAAKTVDDMVQEYARLGAARSGTSV